VRWNRESADVMNARKISHADGLGRSASPAVT